MFFFDLIMNSISRNTERLVPDIEFGERHQYDNRPSGRGGFIFRSNGLAVFINPDSLLSENKSLLQRQLSSSPFLNNSLFLDNAVNTSK